MNNEEILKEYVIKFGYPFLLQTMSYEDPFYIELMEIALKKNEPLEKEDIENASRKIQYDIYEEDDEMSASEYAYKYGK